MSKNIYYSSDDFTKLISNGPCPLGSEISFEDQFYRSAFERINAGKPAGYNHASLFFGGAWLLYRRMYLYAFITISLYFLCVGFLANYWYRTYPLDILILSLKIDQRVFTQLLESYGLAVVGYFDLVQPLPTFWSNCTHLIMSGLSHSTIFMGILFCVHQLFGMCLGFFGNRLYVRHIRKKMRKGYHLAKISGTSKVLPAWFWKTVKFYGYVFLWMKSVSLLYSMHYHAEIVWQKERVLIDLLVVFCAFLLVYVFLEIIVRIVDVFKARIALRQHILSEQKLNGVTYGRVRHE
ncbi:MAG: hypothetical protein NWR39_00430 [Pseudomonadota bacterium]|jgi:hypothetical protein|nr:hypothetical protein [Alphaproteobacteria bacterium]MDP5370030.1 hypothetical protein [Pseudomonadota bacterium]